MLAMNWAALLEKIRKAEKYIDSSMLEDREMKGGNGSISLKVSQLLSFVLPLASKFIVIISYHHVHVA